MTTTLLAGPTRALTSGRAKASRRLHIVDIENMAGCPPSQLDDASIAELVAAYQRCVDWQTFEHAIVACNPFWMFAVHGAWRPCSLHIGHGPNGADRALLQIIDPLAVVRAYSEVWVGSGDGAFADLARVLRADGCRVTVVARLGGLSRALASHTDQIRWFAEHDPCATATTPGAAA